MDFQNIILKKIYDFNHMKKLSFIELFFKKQLSISEN